MRIGPSARRSARPSRRRRSRARSRAAGRELVGLMAYEGQIAGVGDRPPGKRLQGRVIRALQRALGAPSSRARAPRSWRPCGASRRSSSSTAAAPAASRRPGREAGRHRARRGLGLLRADAVRQLPRLHAAPGRAVRAAVVRRPGPGVATALGGGYLASGAARARPPAAAYLPAGLRLDRTRAPARCRRRCSGAAARAARRRPRLHAPREGGRAVRALRLAAPGEGARSWTRCRPTGEGRCFLKARVNRLRLDRRKRIWPGDSAH